MKKLTADEVAQTPVPVRCERILDEFDEWLVGCWLQYAVRGSGDSSCA